MSTASISTVLADLFTAPLNAVVDAEERYRKVWAKWIKNQIDLATETVEEGDGANKKSVTRLRKDVDLAALMKTAPVVSLDGQIELQITMRIAAVKETQANFGFGLALGPVHASGGFGFMSRTTEESLFQARATFTLTNTEKTLTDYLGKNGLALTQPGDVNTAIAKLDSTVQVPKIEPPKP